MPYATPPLVTIVNARLQAASSDTRYEPEVSGGQTRPDGVEIKMGGVDARATLRGEYGRIAACHSSAAMAYLSRELRVGVAYLLVDIYCVMPIAILVLPLS